MQDGTLKVEKTESKQPASSMAEAGFSMNVKMVDEHGQEVMLTFRCAYASNSQWLLGHYSNTIKDLIEKGWQASKPGARSTAPANGASNGAPLCPAHRKPMKESRTAGSYFCPRKDDNGDYCREKA